MEEYNGESGHKYRADNPILHQGKCENLAILENLLDLIVAHFRERRVHHQNETYRDRNVGGAYREAVPKGGNTGDDRSQSHAESHC